MSNIKIVFDKKYKGEFIPNGMSENLRTQYVNFIDTIGNSENFSYEYFKKTNLHFSYNNISSASGIMNTFSKSEFVLTSDLHDSTDLFLDREDVRFLYYIGTSGNIHNGLNIFNINQNPSYFENLPDNVIKHLKTKNNFYLYIDQVQEGITDAVIEKIYLDCLKYGIKTSKVILSSDTINFDDLKKIVEVKYTCKIDIKYFMIPWALFQASNFLEELYETNNIVTDFSKNRKYSFLCFNRKLKDSRILMISFLLGKNYNGLLSYDTNYIENLNFEQDTIKFLNPKYSDVLKVGFKKMLETKKSIIDVNSYENHNALIIDNKKLYEESYFSIVTETSTYYDQIRFTEKIFKPIINYHPFIVFGPPHILEKIKMYGFKTFSDFWDESYDLETDRFKRFEKITNIIDDLVTMSENKWDDLIEKMQDILIHNRNVLKNYLYSLKVDEFKNNLNLLTDDKFHNKNYSILK